MKFAYLPNFYGMLNYLESFTMNEKWSYDKSNPNRKNKENPILENYIHHTFRRLVFERNNLESELEKNKKIYISKKEACFNTGLFTDNYRNIYAYFERNKRHNSNLNFVLKGFYDYSHKKLSKINPLPERAQYFNDISDLIYNTNLDLRTNINHILDNENNRKRIPESVRDSKNLTILFEGAIQLAKKKVQANYKVAVPQYYNGRIQLLLPICLVDPEVVDLALAVNKHDGYYTGHTCLTMDMAYNNARLIARPDSEWLRV